MRAGNGQPIFILQEGTRRDTGRNVQSSNIRAARAVADAVRSTLGPKGLDKMLIDAMGDVVITNDGVTILEQIDVEHPGAKMVIEVAQTQEQECGDGTTSSVVLAGELLKRAEDLLKDVHPTLITRGYRLAAERAVELLDKQTLDVGPDDTEQLSRIAHTAIEGKSTTFAAGVLVDTAVRAVRATAQAHEGGWQVDPDHVQIVTAQGGSVEDTEFVDGFVLGDERVHPSMPTRVDDARIALVNDAFEVQKTQVDAEIEITDPQQMQAFVDEEERMLRALVDRVSDAGANVLLCQQAIDDVAEHFLAKQGIYAIESVSKGDMEQLERATGARIVNDIHDLAEGDLGEAGRVDERRVGPERMTVVSGCEAGQAVSVLLRGGTQHVVDEAERALVDGLRVVGIAIEDGKVLPGGGAPEIELALQLRSHASRVGGREQLAVEAFADALEVIPRTLAENAGLNAIDALVALRSAHEAGDLRAGLDLSTGGTTDMVEAGVLEPLRVKRQALQSATDVATMILRIDDVIASKGFAEEDEGGGGPPGGMPPGMGGGGMPPM